MENRGYDRETIKARSEEVFAQVGLIGLEDRKITSLSGGQRQRLAIASVLATNPTVLVLDEPTNHLDIYAKDELARALREFKGTIVLVSHEPEFYEGWVTDIWNIEDWTTKIV